ncbi:MAG: carboxypeptidase-like regulatory domain-containing protein [Bacteroidales bacterium]|nr:carboxypeptidase-like regulatory domain-containing protein [Bacteroidales bacterium]
MKKLLLTITLLLCGIMTFAQENNYSVVKGNVGEKNVNISIINTNFGVSSDDKGNFIMALPRTDKQVGLLFTCIGYQDTLVSVTPNRDTININFKMKETTYMLEAVGVSADKIIVKSDPKYVMFDFEIFDDKVFVLQRKGNSVKECRLLVQDLWLDPIDTISIPNHIKPEEIIVDCTESCQLIGADSVYQVVKMNSSYELMFPAEKERYNKVVKDIIFFTDKYIYFNKLKIDGYYSEFFRIGKESKEKEMMFVCDDTKSYRNIKEEKQWHINYLEQLPQFFGAFPSAEDWETFVKVAWFHTKDNHLDVIDSKLYYFDHFNGKILTYDESMNLLNECEITYPTEEDFWQHKVYKDKAFGKFYTIFGSVVNEIDVTTGKTSSVANADQWMTEKIIIYKGSLYAVTKKRNALNVFESYIERIEL